MSKVSKKKNGFLMSRVFVLLFFLLLVVLSTCYVEAAYLRFVPQRVKQADGTIITCYASGDEYSNWLHTKEGYTIIENSKGYYVYAEKINKELVPTDLRVDLNNAPKYIEKWLKPELDTSIFINKLYQISNKQFEVKNNTSYSQREISLQDSMRNRGRMNNIVLFVRFSDDDEFSKEVSYYGGIFNAPFSSSLKNYYSEVSYSLLNINSYFYPSDKTGRVVSYKDSNPRSYYLPHSTSNPNGYKATNRELRQWQLVTNILNLAKKDISTSFELDCNVDDYVDNITFIIRGDVNSWGGIIWGQQFQYTQNLLNMNFVLHGKTVNNCIIIPENQLSLGVVCHEFFHTLGAPDLYRYENSAGISPVYYWDLMENHLDIPQSMGAYMKYKYGNWIEDIPLIYIPGQYYLNPITSSEHNSYRVSSTNPNEEYLLEYRKPSGRYESNLEHVKDNINNIEMRFSGGMLVYRIDKNSEGKGNSGTLGSQGDEVYIYRPDGTFYKNGCPWNAPFNYKYAKTEINSNTNPSPYLFNGKDGGLRISNIYEEDDKLYFNLHSSEYTYIKYPENFSNGISLEPLISWDYLPNFHTYIIQISDESNFKNIIDSATVVGVSNYKVKNRLLSEKYYYLRVAVLDGSLKKWTSTVIFQTAKNISITSISGELCAGENIQIEYDFFGKKIDTKNEFSILISDKTGSFGLVKKIGTINSTTSGQIICNIPKDISSSRHYRFKIISSVDTSINNTTSYIHIVTMPKLDIYGQLIDNCVGDIKEYKINFLNDSLQDEYIDYSWSTHNAEILNIDEYTKTAKVLWKNIGDAKIILKYKNINSCMDSITKELYISEYPRIKFAGKNKVCSNNTYDYYYPIDYSSDSQVDIPNASWSRKKQDTISVVWNEVDKITSAPIIIKHTNNSNCSDSLLFLVDVYPEPKAEIIGEKYYCKRIYYDYFASINKNIDTNNYIYLWEAKGGGFYDYDNYSKCRVDWYEDTCSLKLKIIDKNTQCASTTIINIIRVLAPEKPIISLLATGELSSSVADFYQWTLNNADILGATSQKYFPNCDGEHAVRVKNILGNCQTSSEAYIYNSSVLELLQEKQIAYEIIDEKIKILNLPDGVFFVELFDLLGNKIYCEQATEIDISKLSSNIYFLKITILKDYRINKLNKLNNYKYFKIFVNKLN